MTAIYREAYNGYFFETVYAKSDGLIRESVTVYNFTPRVYL